MEKLISRIPTECGKEFSEETFVTYPMDADSKELLSRCGELFRSYDRLEDYLMRLRYETGLRLAEISKSRNDFIFGDLSKDEFKSYLDSLSEVERQ